MKRKGYIYKPDVIEYKLTNEQAEFIPTGYWIGAFNRKITSWGFANGSHPEMQFSKDRHNIFYLESIN